MILSIVSTMSCRFVVRLNMKNKACTNKINVEKDYYTLQNRILNKSEYRLCPYCAELTPIGNNVCVNCGREANTNVTTSA